MTKAAFRAYPSTQESYIPYARNKPLMADMVMWDRSGEYDAANYCFTASENKYMCFHFNILWVNVPDTGLTTPLFFISKDNGVTWEEYAGTDISASQYGNSLNPQGNVLACTAFMEAGWMMRAIPCNAFGDPAGPQWNLAPSMHNGYATCNYFEGFEV